MTAEALPSRTALRVSAAVLSLMLGIGPLADSPALSQAQKFQLVYKAQVGQVKRLASTGTITGELGDPSRQKHTAEFRQIEKITFTKVAPTGEITMEDATELSEGMLDGRKLPDNPEENKEIDTATFKADGALVAFLSTDEDKEEAQRAARLFPTTHPIFSDKPVGPGDKWTHEYKADNMLGTRAATGEFELLAIEDKGGVSCAKIKMAYTETAGNSPMTIKGTVWVERTSGDKVAAEWEVVNMPLGDDTTLVNGNLREARVSGGPLPGTPSPRPGDNPIQAAPPRTEARKIDDLVKDFEKVPGLITLYRKKDPSGRETIYAELREDQLDKLLLLQATASTGTTDQVEAGDPIDDLVFQFSRSPDDRLFLTVPNWSHLAPAGTPIERAVKRSYPDAYLQAFRIEARQPERKALLIDMSDFFKGDLVGISQAFMGGSPIPGLGTTPGGPMIMDREKTMILGVRNYPENLAVTTLYHFLRGIPRPVPGTALADTRSAPIAITYNLSLLPVDNGYRPRLADPRIGYIANDLYGVATPLSFAREDREDLSVRYIHRWDLRKKDPKAPLSEPVKPLVFWLDNAIPLEWRAPIREGLLVWNRAFEKIGFKDVVQVKQMPDAPDPKDPNVPSDTGDQRFNVVRWVAADDLAETHAVAHARFNPLTGQVLSGSINITSTWARIMKMERKDLVEPAQTFSRIADYDLAAAQRIPGGSLWCEMAAGKRFSAWMGYQALALFAPANIPDEKAYVGAFLREVVTHEFGHLLGLRHNFAGSTGASLTQLADPDFVNRNGLSASIMDYTPFNLSALRRKGVPFFSPTIGPYDYWAIEYGYAPIAGARTPDDEKADLARIAQRSGAPGHAFQTDEAADGFDPLVTRFDLASDPLAYWQKNMELAQAMVARLDQRSPRKGESYGQFTADLYGLLNQYALGAAQLTRYIGGQSLSRTHRGDVGERPPLSPLDAGKQKQALGVLVRGLFSPGGLTVPPRYFPKLTTRPEAFPAIPGEFPIGDQLANLRRSALRRLFAPMTLARVASNEFKVGGDESKALTLPYLFRTVGDAVWVETTQGKSVDLIRRQLQRQHAELLIDLAVRGGGPDDARMLAWAHLRQLKGRLTTAQSAKGLSEYTRLHYADLLGRINRALDVRMTAGGSGGINPSLLQMLTGGRVAP